MRRYRYHCLLPRVDDFRSFGEVGDQPKRYGLVMLRLRATPET